MKNNNILIVHIALSKEHNGLIPDIDQAADPGRSSSLPLEDPQWERDWWNHLRFCFLFWSVWASFQTYGFSERMWIDCSSNGLKCTFSISSSYLLVVVWLLASTQKCTFCILATTGKVGKKTHLHIPIAMPLIISYRVKHWWFFSNQYNLCCTCLKWNWLTCTARRISNLSNWVSDSSVYREEIRYRILALTPYLCGS